MATVNDPIGDKERRVSLLNSQVCTDHLQLFAMVMHLRVNTFKGFRLYIYTYLDSLPTTIHHYNIILFYFCPDSSHYNIYILKINTLT